MDIKYKVTKLKNNNIEEVKDSVSVEEPLEMILRFETNGKWKNENIILTAFSSSAFAANYNNFNFVFKTSVIYEEIFLLFTLIYPY